jgi:hypothetical protein
MIKIDNKYKGICGTILLHTVLILCLVFMAFKQPVPLPVEEKIELEMESDGGGGGGGSSDIPEETSAATTTETDYVTDNSPDQDNVIAKNSVANNKVVSVKNDRVIDPRLVYKKGSHTNGTGTGDGSGNGSGTGPGSGSGDGGGNGSGHGPGNGSGNGPGFSLKDRTAKSLPAPDFSNIQGKVVVRIKVDPTGKVIDAEAISKGSTIANTRVWKKCEDFALKSKFSPKPDAPSVQQGTITYIIE